MSRAALANAVFWFHLFWLALIILCGFMGVIGKTRLWQRWVVLGTIACQAIFGGCPLITLEHRLRWGGSYRIYKETSCFTCSVIERRTGVVISEWIIIAALVAIFAIVWWPLFSRSNRAREGILVKEGESLR